MINRKFSEMVGYRAEELVNGSDAEMRELAREELKPLQARRDALLQEAGRSGKPVLLSMLVKPGPQEGPGDVGSGRAG